MLKPSMRRWTLNSTEMNTTVLSDYELLEIMRGTLMAHGAIDPDACDISEAMNQPEKVATVAVLRAVIAADRANGGEAVPDGWQPIIDEIERAVRKFPAWPTDPLHALAVLGEEFGELTKSVLQLTYEPNKSSHADVLIEATQTAAMAMRFLKSIDRYEYAESSQHKQNLLAAAPKPDGSTE